MRAIVLGGFLAFAPLVALAQTSGSGGTGTPAPGTVAPSLVLVCTDAQAGAAPSQYCPNDANGNPQVPTVQQGYILSSADYASLEAAIAPFDYTLAGSIFGMGAGLVISSYFLAYPLGVLSRMLRSARG